MHSGNQFPFPTAHNQGGYRAKPLEAAKPTETSILGWSSDVSLYFSMTYYFSGVANFAIWLMQ